MCEDYYEMGREERDLFLLLIMKREKGGEGKERRDEEVE